MPLSSLNVALVPNASGEFSGAGTMPTSDTLLVTGFNSFNFTDLPIANINSTTLANFDTVVLVQFCDVGTALSPSQKNDINNFIGNGGKLIIYDADACVVPVDFSWLIFPFTTNNPGQTGSTGGTLIILENNTLSSNNPASPFFIDTANITTNTDAVGDAIVMVTRDPNWCGDMQATNVNNVTGFVHTYATFGSGLLIYNGLDTNDISVNAELQKIWLFELQQPWNPSGLPCSAPVVPRGISLF